MSFDTVAHNRSRQQFDGVSSVWLFGYGSLIYKVDFPFLEQTAALRKALFTLPPKTTPLFWGPLRRSTSPARLRVRPGRVALTASIC